MDQGKVVRSHEEEFLESMDYGDHSYLYFRRPDGQPAGQVVVYDGIHCGRYRVPFEGLPPEAQKKFLEYAGKKSAKELVWQ